MLMVILGEDLLVWCIYLVLAKKSLVPSPVAFQRHSLCLVFFACLFPPPRHRVGGGYRVILLFPSLFPFPTNMYSYQQRKAHR